MYVYIYMCVCVCVCVFGCKLSLVRLCNSDFGITPVDDITIGITCAAFWFHILLLFGNCSVMSESTEMLS